MRKINGNNKNGSLPYRVRNSHGEHEIANEFKDVYASLYNRSPTQTDMSFLKEELSQEISDRSCLEADKISGYVVKNAAFKMKPKKGDVSGSYTSDAILHAPDIFFDYLALVYRSWLMHGSVSRNLLSCAFIPLYKGGLKDPTNTESYRAIASSSLLLKLFDNVVISLFKGN